MAPGTIDEKSNTFLDASNILFSQNNSHKYDEMKYHSHLNGIKLENGDGFYQEDIFA